ncbi:hypothetical protein TCAL_15039 [Tigriopus californicus]|uniref:Uncharacterized protein n=1 Tax=Tigriopus californicus TaxID=6832 RepID=A0A553P0A4_TIGCA|nr:hypothetical protein TCAL_15039 [Tigriopus californicus]
MTQNNFSDSLGVDGSTDLEEKNTDHSIFDVSLIDNVHSDIARLRGFYGQLVIESREVLLVEARSGADQIRWPTKALKKWFLAKDTINKKEDKDRIVVLITHKNCSSAEGIFTFYSNRAKDIINSLHAVTRNQSVVQPSAFQSGTPNSNSSSLGRGRTSGKKASSSNKMNPLLAFLRRNQSPSGGETAPGNQQGSKAKKSILAKSVSVMDHLSLSGKRGQLDECVDLGGFEDPRRGESLERTIGGGCVGSGGLVNSSTSNSIHGDKKRSASESDLLNVNNKQGCVPGNETGGDKCQNECEEGFYRSFDDIDDIDDLDVLANSNPLEAAVVLRSQLENEYALGEARCSFNSSDSGRMSDTYAETSNSSVTSSSNGSHSNRLYSNTSNCSGDSGAQLSIHSDYSTSGNSSSNNNNHNGFKENALGVLKEQESPNYPPFDNELYGKSISIATKTGNNHHHLLSGASCSTLEKQTPSVGGGGSGARTEYEDPTYSHIYEDNHHHHGLLSAQMGPPPLPPRFATVRKSFTLPHNMSGHTATAKVGEGTAEGQENNAKSKDLSKYFGLHDQGPGSPSKETAQMVALQNLPLSLSRLDEQKKRNLEKFFGIQNTLQNLEQHRRGQHEGTIVVSNNGAELGVSGSKLPSFLTLPKTTLYQNGQHQDVSSPTLSNTNGMSTNPRSRPNSLGFRMDHSSLDPALDNNNVTPPPVRFRANNFRAFNKTLSRLTALEPGENSRSLPTTPDYPPELDSPRRKNLAKFLGLGNFTPSSPTTPAPMGLPLGSPARVCTQGHQGLPPPPTNGILKKSTLSNSTPMDLECGNDELTCTSSSSMRWQSNDGLATPGSLQGGCTPSFLTPMGSPRIFGPQHTTLNPCNQSICDVPSCGPKQSNSMFSIALATNPNSSSSFSSFHTGSLQRGPLQYPLQSDSTRGARSCSLQRGSTLQATQPPKLNRKQEKSLTRSATLDDLEWQKTQPVVWVNNSGGCSFRRGRDIQMRRHSFQQQSQTHSTSIHNSSVILTRRSQSSAGDNKHGPAGFHRAHAPPGATNLDLVVRPSSSLCHHQTPSSLENLNSCPERGSSPKVPKGILKREPVYLTMGGSRLMNAAPVLHLQQTGSNKEPDYLDMNRGSSRMASMPRQRQNSVSFDQSLSLSGVEAQGGGLPSGSFQHTIQAIVHTSDSPGQQKTIEASDQDIYDGITVVESQQISEK